jgi:hypothetical protein
MKNLKLLLFTLITVLCITCKEKPPQQEETPKPHSYGKAGCACIPNYTNPLCASCITEIFMGGETNVRYKAYFTNCSTNDPWSQSCQPDITTPYDVTLCYAQPLPNSPNDCALWMQINDAPDCVKCITSYPYCIRLKASCSTSNNKDYVVVLDDDDPNTGPVVEFEYTVSQDPKFTICCKKPDPTFPSINYTYCCNGDLIKQ